MLLGINGGPFGMAQTGAGDDWGLTVDRARARIDNPDVILVDLREASRAPPR